MYSAAINTDDDQLGAFDFSGIINAGTQLATGAANVYNAVKASKPPKVTTPRATTPNPLVRPGARPTTRPVTTVRTTTTRPAAAGSLLSNPVVLAGGALLLFTLMRRR